MKACIKCGVEKPLSEFYPHAQMGDGHLNKCKTCAKNDAEERRKRLEATNLEWVLAERKRHREKTRRNRLNKKANATKNSQRSNKYRKKHPVKWKAVMTLGNALRGGKVERKNCEVCGSKAQAHHDDYSKPLDVRWLCPKHHAEHHIKLREQELIKKFTSQTKEPPVLTLNLKDQRYERR